MEALKLFKYSRTATLIALSKFEENKWDEQPVGYPNTIRWNAGHVYITAEDFLNKADKNYEIIHPEWKDYFLDGTHPSKWNNEVPSTSEIIAALKEQEDRIFNYFHGKIDNEATEKLEIRTLILDTVESSIQFVTWHEGIHLGIIKSLDIALKLEKRKAEDQQGEHYQKA